MKIIKIASVLAVLFTLSGCASIFGDNSRAVKVDSIPQGASIYVDNQQYGMTPSIVTMPTYIYGGKTVTLRKKGYVDQSGIVNSKFQVVSLLDIFLWPTFFVDVATGNLVKIDPASTTVNMKLVRA